MASRKDISPEIKRKGAYPPSLWTQIRIFISRGLNAPLFFLWPAWVIDLITPYCNMDLGKNCHKSTFLWNRRNVISCTLSWFQARGLYLCQISDKCYAVAVMVWTVPKAVTVAGVRMWSVWRHELNYPNLPTPKNNIPAAYFLGAIQRQKKHGFFIHGRSATWNYIYTLMKC